MHRRFESRREALWGVWEVAVVIKADGHGRKKVNCPREALSLMGKDWPAERGSSYYAARRQCSAFFKRGAAPHAVREAFIAAATEAGILQ
jgi:hypothetical protein